MAYEATVRGYFPPFNFDDYDQVIPNASVSNNGHSGWLINKIQSFTFLHSKNFSFTVQINVGSPEYIVMRGGGLDREYVLDQMHFHWGSEHTLNGRRYALELHMVHHDRRYSLKEAVQVKNGIAVLGVLFHVSAFENEKLQNILNSVDDIADTVGARALIKEPLTAGALLPHNTGSYFRYEGSLTTPSCVEAVIWTVFTRSMPLTVAQLEALKLVKSSGGTELLHNYRQVQPLNRRSLLFVTDERNVEENAQYFHSGATGGGLRLLDGFFLVLISIIGFRVYH